MSIIKVQKMNEVYLRVMSDPATESELYDYFTFDYPNARWTPAYKAKLWDGRYHLFDAIRKKLYTGLFDLLVEFAKKYQHTVEVDFPIEETDFSLEQTREFCNLLNIHSKSNPIDFREYQLDAIHKAILKKRITLVSPVGSGKSAIIYALCRYYLEKGKKIVIIVPSTSLVQQMYNDFADYSSNIEWSVKDNMQMLYSGLSKEVENPILVTTFQSLHRTDKKYLNQFDVAIVDECHQSKSKSLTGILEKMENCQYRIGTTGSLDNNKIHSLIITGVLGTIYKVITTNELIKQSSLSDLKIKSLLLKYPIEVKKECNKLEYQKEIDFLITNDKRNEFICNLALNTTGVTLVLFLHVEKHGKVLYDMIKEKSNGRTVHYIHGGVDVDERESVRKELTESTDSILCASFGTLSTGINIPSISNIIFASPSKSRIRNLQSIGRGLRLNKNKSHCLLFDLTDDLSYKGWKNYSLKHGAERFKLYCEEKFDVIVKEIEL